MKMKNKRIVVVVILFLCAGAGALLWRATRGQTSAASPEQGKQKKPPRVEVAPVRRASITRTLDLTGEVVATDSVVIAATKEGPINYCPWREGDEVQAGEKLVEISREVHRAEMQAAQAALTVAQARLDDLKAGARREEMQKAEADVQRRRASVEETRKSYERQTELIKQDFTSQQSVDQARERMEVAKAELAAAQETLRMLNAGPTATELAVQVAAVEEAAARLELAKAHLAECVITAPFDGTVTRVYVRPGDLASARSPLAEMFAPSSLLIRFSVPEAHAAAVRQDARLTVVLDAHPGRRLSARVVRVYPELDKRMRTRTVEAEITDPPGLLPGMFGRVTLPLETANHASVVPSEAVVVAPNGQRLVFVAENGRAVQRRVVVGVEAAGLVQLLEGVEVGEKVIVAGQQSLKDGAPIGLGEPRQADGSGPDRGQAPGPAPAGEPAKRKAAGQQGARP